MKHQIKKILTESAEETENAGYEFAQNLKGGDIVCLTGDLGSGKTTFVKGIAKGLGIKSRIISPTFVLIRQYKIIPKLEERHSEFILRQAQNGEQSRTISESVKMLNQVQHDKIKKLYHIDLYRLDKESDIKALGLEELFNYKNSVIVIEWAEKLGNLLPKKRWELKFKYLDEEQRE